MAKQANVRNIQLGPMSEPPEDSSQTVPADMPVRRAYSELEKVPKQQKYFVSYCHGDESSLAGEFAKALERFIEERSHRGDTVSTSMMNPSEIADAKRFVVFLTREYLRLPNRIAELAVILSSAPFAQWIAIMKPDDVAGLSPEDLRRNITACLQHSSSQDVADESMVDRIIRIVDTAAPQELDATVRVTPVQPGTLWQSLNRC